MDGLLVIADITGYTAFLRESELEHAEDSLRSLLNLLLDHTTPPLVVSRLQGDAVISYAPGGSFQQGQTLVETIEHTYLAFRQALERMVVNTTCTCNACRNIPNLDLKFFVHYGTFMNQQLGSHIELVGADVNLVFRLSKNTVNDKLGYSAYAMYTAAVADAMDMGEICGNMTSHTESYEDVGDVETFVQDLNAVWEQGRDHLRVSVRPGEEILKVDYELPYPPGMMWDYLTKPESRAFLMGSDRVGVTGKADGRVGQGTVYECVHGKKMYPQTIVDWLPPEECTSESSSILPKTTLLATVRLRPTARGTMATLTFGGIRGPLIFRLLDGMAWRVIGRFVRRDIVKGFRKFHAIVDKDVAQATQSLPAPPDIVPQQVEDAVAQSLRS
jgi:hypothetical protein